MRRIRTHSLPLPDGSNLPRLSRDTVRRDFDDGHYAARLSGDSLKLRRCSCRRLRPCPRSLRSLYPARPLSPTRYSSATSRSSSFFLRSLSSRQHSGPRSTSRTKRTRRRALVSFASPDAHRSPSILHPLLACSRLSTTKRLDFLAATPRSDAVIAVHRSPGLPKRQCPAPSRDVRCQGSLRYVWTQ